MQSKYALRCLAAQGIAQNLCDQVQAIYDRNMAIAKAKTTEQAMTLVSDAIETLPPPFRQSLTDADIAHLITQLL